MQSLSLSLSLSLCVPHSRFHSISLTGNKNTWLKRSHPENSIHIESERENESKRKFDVRSTNIRRSNCLALDLLFSWLRLKHNNAMCAKSAHEIHTHMHTFSRQKNDLTSKENIVVPTIKHFKSTQPLSFVSHVHSSSVSCAPISTLARSLAHSLTYSISNGPLCHLEASFPFSIRLILL